MRLTLNGWFWPLPHVGSGQYIRSLLPALADLVPGDARTLALAHAGDAPPALAQVRRWRPPRLKGGEPGDVAKTWFEQVVFPRLARDAHVAHVPYFAPPLLPSVPTVVTVHDLIPLVLPEYRGAGLTRLYFRLVAVGVHRAAHVIADSEFSRRDILRHLRLPPQRVTTIHLAAAPRFRPAPPDAIARVRAKHALPETFILYLGGFELRKDVATLLAAYAELRRQGVRAPLVCAGGLPRQDSAITPDPRRAAEQLGVDGVRFLGWVADEEQPSLLSAASVFCFPSRYEGFGLPPLEAMACGAPTVVADATSLPEVVGDGALRFPPGDAAALAASVRRVLDDAELSAALRARGLARAAQFSWARAAQQTREVYEQAAR